jgi:hypothetical protein
MESTGNGVVDFGRFLTGFLVVMGIGKLDRDGMVGAMRTRVVACPTCRRHEEGRSYLQSRITDDLQPFLPFSGIRRKSLEAQQPCLYSAVF